jgi:hypothetical protein
LPRFFGITNTFSPFFRLPPPAAADEEAVPLPALDDVPAAEDVAAAEDDDDELLDPPQAARLSAATVATRTGPDQPRRRVHRGRALTSGIRRLLCWA